MMIMLRRLEYCMGDSMKFQYKLSTFLVMTLVAAALLYLNLFPDLSKHSPTNRTSIYSCEWRGWPVSVVWRENILRMEHPEQWNPIPVGAIGILPDPTKIAIACLVDFAFAICALSLTIAVLERGRAKEQASRSPRKWLIAIVAMALLTFICVAYSKDFYMYDLVYFAP
jgi:hypothetical protein